MAGIPSSVHNDAPTTATLERRRVASGDQHSHGGPASRDEAATLRDDHPASREGYLLLEAVRDDRGRVVDLAYVDVNRAAERLTGTDGHAGRLVSETEPDALPAWLHAWQRVMRTGDPEGAEVWSARTERWFDTYLSPADGPNGNRGVVIFHDITARRTAEAALREREARLALALAIGDVGTWSWDLKTGTGDIDERAAEIVGLPPGNLEDVVATQRALIHPDDLARMDRDIAQGIASGQVFTLDYRVSHPDGTTRHVSSRAQVFADESGEPRTLLGTNRDVTAERQVESSLREREERYRTSSKRWTRGSASSRSSSRTACRSTIASSR